MKGFSLSVALLVLLHVSHVFSDVWTDLTRMALP